MFFLNVIISRFEILQKYSSYVDVCCGDVYVASLEGVSGNKSVSFLLQESLQKGFVLSPIYKTLCFLLLTLSTV